MFVTEPGDKIGVVSFNSEGKISKGEVLSFYDNSNHVIQLSITETGYHNVFVFCNGLQLQNSPFIYTVGHSVYKEVKGFVTNEKIIINAGVGFIVHVKLFDMFGNLVLTDPGISFTMNLKGTCTILDFDEGCYRVVVTLIEIGSHLLEIKGNGIRVLITYEDVTDFNNITEV